jgi:hypothetical protein
VIQSKPQAIPVKPGGKYASRVSAVRAGTSLASNLSMLRIQRFASGNVVLLVLSGRIEAENVPQLQALIAVESAPIVFDLKEVNLVSREVVRFLAQCEGNGVKIQNCSAYIRKWMVRE